MKKSGGSCEPDVLDSNYGVERFELFDGSFRYQCRAIR